MLSPVAREKKHCSDVNTPDFEAEFMELESHSIPRKSSAFSRKGNPLSLTSAPTSLFNSPEELQYTQGLEQTLVHKYSAVKEVFNNLSGEETESAESKPSSPLSPPLITGLSVRHTAQPRILPPLLPDTLLDESGPDFNSVVEGTKRFARNIIFATQTLYPNKKKITTTIRS